MRQSRYNIVTARGDSVYVFNSLSGALLRIPKQNYDLLQRFLAGEKGAACPPKLLSDLAMGFMLIPHDRDEIALLKDRYRASRDDTSRFALTIVTSLGCNFDCPYCFEEKHPSIMGAEVQQSVLQILDAQLPSINSFHVTWFGGEPLVGKRALLTLSDGFIERCDQADVAYDADIVTNGYLLDEATCAQLAARRIQSAQIGLDGPPEVHDRMRPQANGRGSFWRIIENVRHAVSHFRVGIRVNIDTSNFDRVEELFCLLAAEGFAGKLNVYPGQIVGLGDNILAPSARYGGCFTNPEFAEAERHFLKLAEQYGLTSPSLPTPTGAPCTAVRANELVVGSHGELYKCWDNVGNDREIIGHITDYKDPNGRITKWLSYDPFSNDECRACIALPVCMGGCAHHAFSKLQYENRCGTFRHTYRDTVSEFVDYAERRGIDGLTRVAHLARRMENR